MRMPAHDGQRAVLHALVLCTALLAGSAMAYDLQRHLWTERLLFLVAPEFAELGLQQQLAVVAEQREAVMDRDLRVFALANDRGEVDGAPLGRVDVLSLRDQLRLAPHARALILVGLDGRIKSRAPLETSLDKVFQQIDAMPMRQQELRERAAGSAR